MTKPSIGRVRPAGLLALAVALAGLATLAGCFSYKSDTPLLTVNGTGIGRPNPQPANIPPGPEHQVCRDELGKALAQINDLQNKLAKCKVDKDALKRERDDYKHRWQQLGGRE